MKAKALANGEKCGKMMIAYKEANAVVTLNRQQTSDMNRELLADISNRLRRVFNPEKIIVFGSFARGDSEEDSDLDVLVILPDEHEASHQKLVDAHRSLRGIPIPVDIVVKSRKDVERYKNVRSSFVHQVLKEGKVLYG